MPLEDKTEIVTRSNQIMAQIKDDSDVSALDWGSSNESTGGTTQGPSSRYDPKAMSRIVDITDLVDESGDDDTDDEDDIIRQNSFKSGNGASSMPTTTITQSKKNKKRGLLYGPGGAGFLMYRQVLILVALVGVIVAASVAIGYAVIRVDSSNNTWTPSMRGGDAAGGNISNNQEQQLLELAERVITACSESQLDNNMSECQKLCHGSMCCFEDDSCSCEDDEKKNCAVYAGCANLMEGVPLGAAEEDEE